MTGSLAASSLPCDPLFSLYVHFPWCVHKCPYCDFNSHAVREPVPEEHYIDCLLADLDFDLARIPSLHRRSIKSIFFGGGTPSLISGKGMKSFLEQLVQRVEVLDEAEITLEANPGTVDSNHFVDYWQAGINRLSIGVQSLRDLQLKQLGRIHTSNEAIEAFGIARKAGFDNINLDLMFGLPEDDIDGCLADLSGAIELQPEHLSWYQLTMEPNTLFYHQPPVVPDDDRIWQFQQAGQLLLSESGYRQYEISAYARDGHQCQHNLNYWSFGDYLGIGAGAHSKITGVNTSVNGTVQIERFSKARHPKDYLKKAGTKEGIVEPRFLQKDDRILEFMMNVLRLNTGFTIEQFEKATCLGVGDISKYLDLAQQQELISYDGNNVHPTAKGSLFLNDLLGIFSD